MLSISMPCADLETLKNLEVIIDGERLFEAQRRTLGDRITCAVLTLGTRIIGLVLLAVAVINILRADPIVALYAGSFGVLMILAGNIGLRQFQNAPRRLILDENSLRFVDSWMGVERRFPRQGCLEVQCGSTDAGCAVYLTHPDKHIELLIEGVPHEAAIKIAETINRHLEPVRSAQPVPA